MLQTLRYLHQLLVTSIPHRQCCRPLRQGSVEQRLEEAAPWTVVSGCGLVVA